MFEIVKSIVAEPMFILLVIACILYFLLGETAEGFMMVAAIAFVSGISLYQDVRSTRALEALKEYAEPGVRVIRDGRERWMPSVELVPGDIVALSEGNKVPADCIVLEENDLSVNESVITGESLPVEKHDTAGENQLLQGTTINSGKCYAKVSVTGNATVLGRIGAAIHTTSPPQTLLQKQVQAFVKKLAAFGITAFIVICLLNYLQSGLWIQSVLFGLTLAMAAIPEEIPVAFSSFMALGAYHMSRLGIISRQPQVIENLGAVNVICLDKTGTLTENRMSVINIFDVNKNALYESDRFTEALSVLYYAMLASEDDPFDPMEQAIHQCYDQFANDKAGSQLRKTSEYPLEGRPPMMTHIYTGAGGRIAVAKGATERILRVCRLSGQQLDSIQQLIGEQAAKGYRVIGVANATVKTHALPTNQDDFPWEFEGFISLYDPPKPDIDKVVRQLYDAGIDIKVLSGDHLETVINIASRIGIKKGSLCLTGEQVMQMDDLHLKESLKKTVLLARMFPDAKLRVINLLKSENNIVAMTGDGVNDAPSLQSSDIGIAMGKKGTEMARQTADLIITDDDLQKVVEAVRQGRKIYSNLKKAVRYIISIHIPIILTVSLPLMLGWKFPNIFTPVHVIFLELIMGPTCSIFFEREPVEDNLMQLPPRKRTTTLLLPGELLINIVQGLLITFGSLWAYHFAVRGDAGIETTRTMVFTTMLFANLFLTFSVRSYTETIAVTIRYKNNLAWWIFFISLLFIAAIHLITPIRTLFGLSGISAYHFVLCVVVAFLTVAWFELFKLLSKEKTR